MKVLLSELNWSLPLCGIYKIDFPNGKTYIGLSMDIERRMNEHNREKDASICNKAIKKYLGQVEEFELLFTCPHSVIENDQLLFYRLEAEYIKQYHSLSGDNGYNCLPKDMRLSGQQGEYNPRSVFTKEQVIDIRKRRWSKERKKDVYADYQDYSFSSFENIWLGQGYPEYGTEYLISTNSKTRAQYSKEANTGEKNGMAKLNKEDVVEIRRLFNEEKKNTKEIHALFSQVSLRTIQSIVSYRTWKKL